MTQNDKDKWDEEQSSYVYPDPNFGTGKHLRPFCKKMVRNVYRLVNGKRSKRIAIEIPLMKELKKDKMMQS